MIPTLLKIDEIDWEVKIAEVTHDEYGETRPEECQTTIANRLTEQMRESTFWHELIHMIFAVRDLSDKSGKAKEKAWTEEEIATMLGPALYSFFKANATISWKGPSEA